METVLEAFRFRLVVRRARHEIEEVARRYCPTAKVASFSGATPKRFSFRIAVPTDQVRDQMRNEPELYQQFCSALRRAGYPEDAVPFVHFRIESQETVDRDHAGSWAEEAEMP